MPTTTGKLLTQGMIAGFIGYAVLALLFAAVNVMGGENPFHTAAVLGAALFYGASDPATVAVTPAYVFAYNGAHLLVFLGFGLIGASLAFLADRGVQLWYLALFFFLFVAFHAVGAAQALSEEMQADLSGTAIWLGGILASGAMAAYLLWRHPRLRHPDRWDG